MKLLRSILGLLVCATAWPAIAGAQATDAVALADSLSRMVYRAAITGDRAQLYSARTLAERALTAHAEDALLEHHHAESYYREATWLSSEHADSAQVMLERAQAIVDETVERNGGEGALAETHALRGSIIGMRITNMLKGMTMGPRADRALDRALELGPSNPRVWLAKGISTLHKPGFTGGGADNALEALERGIALLDSDRPGRGHPVGGGAELWAWVGVAHLREDRRQEARTAFEQALALEPDFAWVREVLLPEAHAAGGG